MNSKPFDTLKAYVKLADQLKEQLAECARVLALNVAHNRVDTVSSPWKSASISFTRPIWRRASETRGATVRDFCRCVREYDGERGAQALGSKCRRNSARHLDLMSTFASRNSVSV